MLSTSAQFTGGKAVGAVEVVVSEAEVSLVDRERVERTQIVGIDRLIDEEDEDQGAQFSFKRCV